MYISSGTWSYSLIYFSDKNNPDGILRKSSYVFCTHCNKAFNFTQSKVIKDNEKDFTMNTKVHCIHCGKDYFYKEASVVNYPDNDEPLVMCKHYPECDGSLIDMMEVEE